MRDSQRELPTTIQKANFLPPWLWCWLLLYLTGFFHSYTYILTDLNIIMGAPNAIFSSADNVVELAVTISEFVTLLAIFAGILVVFLPWLRSNWLRVKYNIQSFADAVRTEPATATQLTEIQKFIHSYAPEIRVTYAIGFADRTLDELRVRNQVREQRLSFLLRKYWHKLTNPFVTQLQDPITYRVSYLQTTITVTSSLLNVWKNNRPKAQEILLHELAHHYHGDAAIIGAGSLLEAVSRSWIWLSIICTILPFIILDTIYYIAYARSFELIHKIVPGTQQTISLYILQNIWQHDVLALLQSLTFSLLWNATNFSILIIAIWSAELNADRFARDNTHSRQMFENGRKQTIWRWIFAGTHHPPFRLRKWVTEQEGILSSSLLLLLFPLSFVIYLLLLCAQNFVYGLSPVYSGEGINDLLKLLYNGVITYLRGMLPILLCLVIVLLLWPIGARAWQKLFHSNTGSTIRQPYPAYIVSAAIVLCGILGILLFTQPASTLATANHPRPVATPTQTIPTDNMPIPTLEQDYKGTLEDAANHTQTQLVISAIQQDQQGRIHGIMTIAAPLAKKGTLNGTIMNSRLVLLTFTPDQRPSNAIIQLTGTLQKDGTLVGFYTISGTEQIGNWQAQPTQLRAWGEALL